jgi:hypothetical protein
MTKLYIAGEDIEPGCTVVVSQADGKVYRAWPGGALIGNAAERIREGFRISESGGEVREDDA